MEERVIHFCRAPSGLWIGWIVKDNAHYWGSGRTMDDLVMHVKNTLYQAKKCSTAGYIIASRPSTPDEVPMSVMGQTFKTRAWYGGTARAQEAMEKALLEEQQKATQQKTESTDYDYYEYKVVEGKLVVFGVIRKEVASYTLATPKTIPLDAVEKTTLHLPDVGTMLFNNKTNADASKPAANWKPREDFPKD